MAILYNMGTNFVFGSISYITKALVAVLQLAVTMDYSIFLWHSYQDMKKQHDDNVEAMAYAIKETFISIASSSLTTIAGFLALCFMSYKMGKDLGIVMAKGVVFGLISCVTILPSLILIFDKLISKTMHKSLIPNMNKFSGFVTKNYLAFVIIAICLFIPSTIGYAKKPIYYDFTKILETEDGEGINQDDILSIVADMKLKEEYGVSSTHMILCDAKMNATKATTMLSELEKVNGVKLVLWYNSLVSDTIPEEIIPDRLTSILKSNNWQLILVNSEYTASTTDCNNQLENLNKIIKNYDDNAMLIGEATCTKDLISITEKIHGMSHISAYVMCHKELTWKEKLAKWLTGNIFDIYDHLYASKNVIKNQYYNPNVTPGFYGCDTWKYADDYLRPYLQKGMTIWSRLQNI